MITKINNKVMAGVLSLLLPLSTSLLTSCEDFLDQDSTHVIYADQEHLNSAADTLYSMVGIVKKLQVIADRTHILGEVRGDLVDYTDVANADLRQVALFNVDDDNVYNSPKDYYAVINNCNYYISHVDSLQKNSLGTYVFAREYSCVKAIRAWTYLQLAINYGRVPLVTDPILTQAEAEANYPRYDLAQICDYFINDLQALINSFPTVDVSVETPMYGSILGLESRYFFFPVSVVLADLHLWKGSATNDVSEYKAAAENYYTYLSHRNGLNSGYQTGDLNRATWELGATSFTYESDRMVTNPYSLTFIGFDESKWEEQGEFITILPGDSLPMENSYSQLRNLYNSNNSNNWAPSLVPSKGVRELAASQVYCNPGTTGESVRYVTLSGDDNAAGDLRLYSVWLKAENRYTVGYLAEGSDGSDTEYNTIPYYQQIAKIQSRNVPILRRQMVYLRLAEALNLAGYPHMAFQILCNGLTNKVMKDEKIYERYPAKSDSLYMAKFNFGSELGFNVMTLQHLQGIDKTTPHNTLGMHSRGSGWTPLNEYYRLPNDTIEPDPAKRQQLLAEQQAAVDSLILNEDALEFMFEGVRYYDLMRFALRSSDQGGFMLKHVAARQGKARQAALEGQLSALKNPQNWYLKWNGKIGIDVTK